MISAGLCTCLCCEGAISLSTYLSAHIPSVSHHIGTHPRHHSPGGIIINHTATSYVYTSLSTYPGCNDAPFGNLADGLSPFIYLAFVSLVSAFFCVTFLCQTSISRHLDTFFLSQPPNYLLIGVPGNPRVSAPLRHFFLHCFISFCTRGSQECYQRSKQQRGGAICPFRLRKSRGQMPSRQ